MDGRKKEENGWREKIKEEKMEGRKKGGKGWGKKERV